MHPEKSVPSAVVWTIWTKTIKAKETRVVIFGIFARENPIISYLFIAVVIKYSLLEKGACRKWKWSKNGSLSLLTRAMSHEHNDTPGGANSGITCRITWWGCRHRHGIVYGCRSDDWRSIARCCAAAVGHPLQPDPDVPHRDPLPGSPSHCHHSRQYCLTMCSLHTSHLISSHLIWSLTLRSVRPSTRLSVRRCLFHVPSSTTVHWMAVVTIQK